MAHSGDGTGWTITDPTDSEFFKDGAKEIRDLRTGVGIRSDKEHVALAGSSAGGEHKEGSAKAYYEATGPTNRPDGSTALTAADAGRLWVDSDDQLLYHYNGSAWALITCAVNANTNFTNDTIPASALVTDLEGAALGITADVLDVKVDDSTIEVATDALQVKDSGIVTAKINDLAVTSGKLAASAVILGKVIENTGMLSAAEIDSYTGNGLAAGPTITFAFDPDFILIYRDPSEGTTNIPTLGHQGDTSMRTMTGATVASAYTWGSNNVQIKTANANINTNLGTYHVIALRF
jgi:hypothetical protein